MPCNNAATSPLGHVGVAAALAAEGAGVKQVKPTIWDEFALRDRVALVSGGNRGLGLEMALVLSEAGARAVYCIDLPGSPGRSGSRWQSTSSAWPAPVAVADDWNMSVRM